MREEKKMFFSFAEKIAVIRECRKLSGEELGETLGVRKSTIHHYETGKTETQDPLIRRKVERMFIEVQKTYPFWGIMIQKIRKGEWERYRKQRDHWG